MESLCMAGNWWLPVVSVMWRVHTAGGEFGVFDEITFL